MGAILVRSLPSRLLLVTAWLASVRLITGSLMAGRTLLCLALMPAFLHGGAVPRPALGAALRCRGGRDGEHPAPAFSSSVRSAARKLCASPPLLAAKPAEAKSAMPASLQRHMRGIVFGGMDGILTTFALLAAVAGSGGTSPALTLVIGISTVLADGFSMGAGEYISAKAEAEVEGGTNDEETTPLEKGVAVSRRPPATSHHSCVRLLPPLPAVARPLTRRVWRGLGRCSSPSRSSAPCPSSATC